MLFGCYFFLDMEMVVHSRRACTFWDVLSNFGGIFDIVLVAIGVIFSRINENGLLIKFIRNLYFTELDEFHID
jgi:hypothetical protein